MDSVAISILVVLCLFLIGMGIAFMKEGEFWFGLFWILIVVIPFSVFMIDYYVTDNTIRSETEASVTVINKERSNFYVTYVNNISITHPEQWNITISDNDFEQTFDNKELYDSLKINDKIIVNKIAYTKKNGEIYKKEFEFIKRRD